MSDPLVYSPEEAAAILGVHRETVRRWLASGRLPGRKVGGLWLISARRLSDWVDSVDARRTSGMGSVYKRRSDGRWVAAISSGPRGRRTMVVRYAKVKGKLGKEEAEGLLSDLRKSCSPA